MPNLYLGFSRLINAKISRDVYVPPNIVQIFDFQCYIMTLSNNPESNAVANTFLGASRVDS